ncbi:methylated-DNA--[protein]-cysteine S-methyltransferase [Flagellimonas allohymeniacidonis]|uniref:methylated-DNA--[protein]-cysteine S-methyltransferase n=1 Tax=Flagellimonas allohymeniacidonis TaxID=2517819 RepID=A0A4Q8QG09_9FLAO|nr:methylated-DNA--[protein]-cysteine S-methyltransferase [Allomuricauda hymeniacidonis]TAI49482.1 methylated-DNA--[protein]-cysteine S-methyltransferase [Allomuricauda hymeniacidonis]
MTSQEQLNYDRIAKSIEFIKQNFKEQPSLNEIAESANLSPFHFQRMFTEWAGVSPKKFMQYMSLNYAKLLLKEKGNSLFDAALDTGLSSTSRLHDLFVNIEGMTPGEYKNGGENLIINYSFAESPFGRVIVASTSKGICHMAFMDDEKEALTQLKSRFPKASYLQKAPPTHAHGLSIFQLDWGNINTIKLHLQGTPFQLKVWQTLLTIPMGNLDTYGIVAKRIGKPNASRAVGSAIGNNPVAFLIPCHRVIQSSGQLGGYMWGETRKSAILGWEASQVNASAVL